MNIQVTVTGPYLETSSPYGYVLKSMNRDNWYVHVGDKVIGKIIKFHDQKRRYVIDQLYPTEEFTSLRKAIAFLAENKDKLVFCS